MNKAIKYILLLVLAGGLIGGGAFYYMYNKPHQNIEEAPPEATLSVGELFAAFESDEDAANKKYLGKIVQISGVVSQIQTSGEGMVNVILTDEMGMASVNCTIHPGHEKEAKALSVDAKARLKGKCTGFSLFDVSMDRCVVVE